MGGLTNIDRRIIYGILLLIVIVGLLVPLPIPIRVSPATEAFYDTVARAPVDKLAIVTTTWSAATRGENGPQTRMIMTHLMSRHIRFAIMSFDQQSTKLAQALANELAPQFGYEYGRDWVNWGYRADITGTLKGIVQDIDSTIGRDSILHQPLATFPAMRGVRNIQDVSMVLDASPSATYTAFIGLLVGANKQMAYCFAPTSVMAPQTYSYLDSGQMKGMMFGIKGAAEYEELLVEHHILKEKGFTTRAMTPVSFALILLFVFIGLGNYGMLAGGRPARRGTSQAGEGR